MPCSRLPGRSRWTFRVRAAARPVFSDVKHKLRDWIDGRLHEFRDEEEVRAFAPELNTVIRGANLSRASKAVPDEGGCLRGQPEALLAK